MRFGISAAFGHFRSSKTAPYFETAAFVAATQVWLYPREQFIQDKWIELLKVKMASVNSINNGTFVPLSTLFDWVSPAKSARELRVACLSFSLSWPPSLDPSRFDTAPYRLLGGAPIPLALTESGPAVAHIHVEYSHTANIVTNEGRRTYVIISSDDRTVALGGYIPANRISDSGRRASSPLKKARRRII